MCCLKQIKRKYMKYRTLPVIKPMTESKFTDKKKKSTANVCFKKKKQLRPNYLFWQCDKYPHLNDSCIDKNQNRMLKERLKKRMWIVIEKQEKSKPKMRVTHTKGFQF